MRRPGYGIYGANVDARLLADVIVRHAAAVTEDTQALKEVRRAEEPPELLRFETSVPSGSAPVDDDDDADDELFDSSTLLSVHVASAARRVCGAPARGWTDDGHARVQDPVQRRLVRR